MWSVIRDKFRRQALLTAFASAALVAVGLGVIAPESVQAATLYVTEYATGVTNAPGSDQAQIPPQPSLATQTVSITGASLSSSAFNASTHAVDLYCDSGCSIAIGSSPTATTSLTVLTSNQHQTFGVSPGQKVAVIANTSGTPSGGGGGAVTIADGADVTQGAIADAAVAAGAAGTVNAHLRTISGQLPATVGQKTMAASLPVVIASDQSSFPVTIAAGAAVIGHVIADTGSTTAVTQATASNLNVTVVGTGTFADQATLQAGSAIVGKVGIDQTTPGTTNAVQVVANTGVTTLTTAITRPSDTNAYAANDALANSTTVPTSGGFTLTSACRASGGNGTILSAAVSASASTAYQGEIWIFDQAVTATNDNAALSVSDSDILNLVGVIPFNTTDVNAANAISYVTGLNIGYTCSGTANLRYLVKILAAVTPASAEVLNLRVQVQN